MAVEAVGRKHHSGEVPGWLFTETANNLASLGHVEFAFDSDLTWVICPPPIVGTPTLGQGTGVFCGSRTSATFEKVRSVAREREITVTEIPQVRGPVQIKLEVENEV